MNFYDLASLAKPLVTAPLALAWLELDTDRRWALGFRERPGPLTVRQMLSHSAGLPPWLPYTGESLAAQIRRGFPAGAHPLLANAAPGTARYSDLGYRLLAELLERETGLPWTRIGAAASGLSPVPWKAAPMPLPPGPDLEAWALSTERPFPEPSPARPHDANARAGMIGHAGFGATAPQLEACLRRWIGAGWPRRMAVEAARTEDGAVWGLGLQRASRGAGRLAQGLEALPPGAGLRVIASDTRELSAAPPLGPAEGATGWWFHLAFTGPALFVRPSDGACVALLCHRLGPAGGLLDAEALRARRLALLDTLAR